MVWNKLSIEQRNELVEAMKEGKGFEICNAGTKVYVWQNKSSN